MFLYLLKSTCPISLSLSYSFPHTHSAHAFVILPVRCYSARALFLAIDLVLSKAPLSAVYLGFYKTRYINWYKSLGYTLVAVASPSLKTTL